MNSIFLKAIRFFQGVSVVLFIGALICLSAINLRGRDYPKEPDLSHSHSHQFKTFGIRYLSDFEDALNTFGEKFLLISGFSGFTLTVFLKRIEINNNYDIINKILKYNKVK